MARSRTLRPSFFTSFTLAKVNRDARLLFAGLWIEADDDGRLIDSPKLLAGAVFPHDEDVTAAKVKRWLDDLEAIGAVERYSAGEGQYLHIPGFAEHQKTPHRTPSKLPPPSREVHENSVNGSGEPQAPVSVSVSDYVQVSVSDSAPPEAGENRDVDIRRDDKTETETPEPAKVDIGRRIACLCTGRNRQRVTIEAAQLTQWATRQVDPRIIEESITWFAGKAPPDLPRAFAAVITSKARDHGITMTPFRPTSSIRAAS